MIKMILIVLFDGSLLSIILSTYDHLSKKWAGYICMKQAQVRIAIDRAANNVHGQVTDVFVTFGGGGHVS